MSKLTSLTMFLKNYNIPQKWREERICSLYSISISQSEWEIYDVILNILHY